MKNFKLILRSLINNQACVEGGRSKPLYFAIIMFFFIMIISILPTFVFTINRNGADFINTQTIYNYDLGLQRFSEELYKSNFDIVVSDSESGHYLTIAQETWDNKFTTTNENGLHCYRSTYEVIVNNEKKELTALEVYYLDGTITQQYLDMITQYKHTVDEKEVTEYRKTSFLVFSRYTYQGSIFISSSNTSKGAFYGDYKTFEVGYNFKNLAVVGDLNPNSTFTPATLRTYTDGVLKNWKDSFNVGYTQNKYTALWQTTLLMFGVNIALTVFMGIMLFILTRGKNNPYRIYTFWETQKIAYWAAPAPSVIGMAMGFLLASFSQVTFPLVMGLRVMWLSMRTLRPENANDVTTADYRNKDVVTVNAKPVKK